VAAHQEKAAKRPLKAQTGWSFWTDHPVRAFQRMPSAISFDGTATPPILGGNYPLLFLRLFPNSTLSLQKHSRQQTHQRADQKMNIEVFADWR
jgi:hypothetical protein